MLKQVATGVLIHESAFCRSNTVVVDGDEGALLIDPGILADELLCLAADLRESGRTVAAGFSTHPHWDHVLWHPALGEVPRLGTAPCAETITAARSAPGFTARLAGVLPPDIAGQVPLDLLGAISGLPPGETRIPWDGPEVRIVEHRAHAPGHAALMIEDRRALVAGDMLSDVLVPMLDGAASDAIEDHLGALLLLERVAKDVDVLIPGHGAVGDRRELLERIDLDRAYLLALRDRGAFDDPRIGPSAPFGWIADVHRGQLERLAASTRGEGPRK